MSSFAMAEMCWLSTWLSMEACCLVLFVFPRIRGGVYRLKHLCECGGVCFSSSECDCVRVGGCTEACDRLCVCILGVSVCVCV